MSQEVTMREDAGATRHYLMCPPTYFDVNYSINPWMQPEVPTDTGRAVRQWEVLVETFRALGHDVDLVDPVPGLPDMVFAANAALVIDGKVLGARFRHTQRREEAAFYMTWLSGRFHRSAVASVVNEGEGDYLLVGDYILGGYGFRSDPTSRAEVQEFFGRPVVQLQLVDPRFYHLDTALAVLDQHTVAYVPSAFSEGSQLVLRRLFPDAVLASEADAAVFGLNAVSDGRSVVLPVQARSLANQLRARGYEPVPVDLSELLKAGGGAKCCTLELHHTPAAVLQ